MATERRTSLGKSASALVVALSLANSGCGVCSDCGPCGDTAELTADGLTGYHVARAEDGTPTVSVSGGSEGECSGTVAKLLSWSGETVDVLEPNQRERLDDDNVELVETSSQPSTSVYAYPAESLTVTSVWAEENLHFTFESGALVVEVQCRPAGGSGAECEVQ